MVFTKKRFEANAAELERGDPARKTNG
jgi:hypothetical protein